MCLTYNDALSYLTGECSGWNGADKLSCENSIAIIENSGSTQQQKEDAMIDLSNLYWDSTQISDRVCFGQSVFVISETVDPNRPFPEVRV